MQNGIQPGVVVRNGTSRSFNITQVIYNDQGTCTCVPVNKPGQGKIQQDLSPLKIFFLVTGTVYTHEVWCGMVWNGVVWWVGLCAVHSVLWRR